MEDFKELTKAEEQIMQELWEMGRGFVKEIIDRLPEPKPAYFLEENRLDIKELDDILSIIERNK